MNRAKRALVATLVAALVLPTVTVAQESGGPRKVPAAAPAEPPRDVQLAFGRRQPVDPWAVFGNGLAASGHAKSDSRGRHVRMAPADLPLSEQARLVGVGTSEAALAQGRLAAKRGAGHATLSCCSSPSTSIVVVLLTAACVVLIVLAGGNPDDWLMRK